MKFTIKSHHTIIGFTLLLYLIPIIATSLYSLELISPNQRWNLLTFGLFFSILSTFLLFILLKSWSVTIDSQKQGDFKEPKNLDQAFLEQAHENQNALSKIEEEAKELSFLLQEKEVELNKLLQEREHYHFRKEELLEEFSLFKQKHEEELNQKQVLIIEYQQTIADQRKIIEKKQAQVDQYEMKVNDLTYEIKTLLKLAETSNHLQIDELQPSSLSHKDAITEKAPPLSKEKNVKTNEEANLQLKKCLNIAQKLTGSTPFNGQSSRFPSFPNIALDQRRLFETLQSENGCGIFVYSQKEKKFIFANRAVQGLVGWPSDKFTQIFDTLVEDGLDEWKSQISRLTTKENAQLRLIIKAKTGEDVFIKCHMGQIPTGSFRNHIIGVLYKD